MRFLRVLAWLLVVVVAAVAAFTPSLARMDGVSGQAGTGCICHGDGVPWEGLAGQMPVIAILEGVPEAYEPGQLYELSVGIGGDFPYLNGGFDLNASAGILSVPGGEDNVQISTRDTFGGVAGEATHKSPSSRAWRVDWTAPREGAGEVTFVLAVNSVNGNSQPDQADLWNQAHATSSEINLPPVAPSPVAVPGGPGAVNVSWPQPEAADIVEIQVHGSTGGGFTPAPATLLTTLGPADQAATLQDLPAGPYTLVLRVVDAGGLSADSEAATVTVEGAPEPVAEAPAPDKGAPGPGLALIVMALVASARRRP